MDIVNRKSLTRQRFAGELLHVDNAPASRAFPKRDCRLPDPRLAAMTRL
jgi:hypothetical protein